MTHAKKKRTDHVKLQINGLLEELFFFFKQQNMEVENDLPGVAGIPLSRILWGE